MLTWSIVSLLSIYDLNSHYIVMSYGTIFCSSCCFLVCFIAARIAYLFKWKGNFNLFKKNMGLPIWLEDIPAFLSFSREACQGLNIVSQMIYSSATIIHQLQITGDISRGAFYPISDNISLNIWCLNDWQNVKTKMEIRFKSSISTAKGNVCIYIVQYRFI